MHLPPAYPSSGWISRWNQLSRLLSRQLREQYLRTDLTESEAALLLALRNSSPTLTQAELACELRLSESNLCSLIERMRADQLLERRRSPLDRRKSVLRLTAAGHRVCNVISSIHAQLENELLEPLSTDAREAVSTVFLELHEALRHRETFESARRRAA